MAQSDTTRRSEARVEKSEINLGVGFFHFTLYAHTSQLPCFIELSVPSRKQTAALMWRCFCFVQPTYCLHCLPRPGRASRQVASGALVTQKTQNRRNTWGLSIPRCITHRVAFVTVLSTTRKIRQILTIPKNIGCISDNLKESGFWFVSQHPLSPFQLFFPDP